MHKESDVMDALLKSGHRLTSRSKMLRHYLKRRFWGGISVDNST